MTPHRSALRVGFVPYSTDLGAPSDRRRFIHYARLRGLDHEVHRPEGRYDLVFLSSLADITHWSRAPRTGTKLVYDLSDSYLHIDRSEIIARVRGPAKFALRQHRHLEWSYHDSIARMCDRADAVLCSTPEQREKLLPFNDNVHAILDFQGAAAKHVKSDYAIGETLHLVWEGQARNLSTFAPIAGPLARLATRRKIALHLVTDLRYRTVNAPVPPFDTKRTVTKLLPGVPTYVYEHNDHMVSAIAAACDIALIPMFRDVPFAWYKAENKLLLFWRMGMPTLTAATPAYVRTMRAAGVDHTCDRDEDWDSALERLASDETIRRDAVIRGRDYAEAEHGEQALARKWDALIESLGA